ncbi:MAG: neutral zinc metallopeptidase [Uliginosibacterium sp.]|nr:neutral zinc metallopeptidase [Uliginosibacterium sp.]MBK9614299.1 neutral zinc metallopeptidase [Uliginosibacterium sp.]
MRLDDNEESRNVEDRRGGGVAMGGKIGVGTIALALLAWYFGIDPSLVLSGANMLEPGAASQTQQAPVNDPAEEPLKRFVGQVLTDTELTWRELFEQSGKQYVEPKLVLFRGATQTACGAGEAAMGPFYCPADQKVYIDLGFYDELSHRFQAPGNAAQAYVIAHEVGHHVQNLLGISAKVQQARRSASEKAGNALSVRMELQADCLAGVWVHHANKRRPILESGDIDRVLGAAAAIGDDTLQKQAKGYVTPESFTHGSAQQRKHWFSQGFESGSVSRCDAFKNGA